jgi:hypothetical protein
MKKPIFLRYKKYRKTIYEKRLEIYQNIKINFFKPYLTVV